MKHFKNHLRCFAKDESGIIYNEYPLIVVIAAGVITITIDLIRFFCL